MAMPAVATLAMSAAPDRDSGLASGLFTTTQQVGAALGLAVVATLAAARTDALRAAGHGTAEALTGGYHVAYGVGAGLVVAAFVVAAVFLRPAVDAEAAGPAKEG